MDADAFRTLRDTPLHELWPSQRLAFAESLLPWLGHPDSLVRDQATERLATAVLWERDPPGISPSDSEAYWAERLAWLTGALEAANAANPLVIPAFLRIMRFRNPSGRQRPVMRAWLDRLDRDPPAGLDLDLVLGARIMMSGREDWEEEAPRWIAWLDHPSDWVRGCAAYMLGDCCDGETVPSEAELFDLIGKKELERPGVAGPFWSPMAFGFSSGREAALWMMDLLERRQGPAPADMPANDIDFHLHELCAASPDMVERMIRGGFLDLALMTATEIAERVEGMEAQLETLARSDRPDTAAAAAKHLLVFYAGDESSV